MVATGWDDEGPSTLLDESLLLQASIGSFEGNVPPQLFWVVMEHIMCGLHEAGYAGVRTMPDHGLGPTMVFGEVDGMLHAVLPLLIDPSLYQDFYDVRFELLTRDSMLSDPCHEMLCEHLVEAGCVLDVLWVCADLDNGRIRMRNVHDAFGIAAERWPDLHFTRQAGTPMPLHFTHQPGGVVRLVEHQVDDGGER